MVAHNPTKSVGYFVTGCNALSKQAPINIKHLETNGRFHHLESQALKACNKKASAILLTLYPEIALQICPIWQRRYARLYLSALADMDWHL
jgi:hypothetical protein